jgi:Fur family ferric uptake transcriptional regulator/Fur family peroxide stress response transcriptional regulator
MNIQTEIQNRLQKSGIKPSLQRMAVMENLMTHPVHPTVDMIYNDLSPFMPTLSKTTVYNTLKLFSDHGVVRTVSIDEKNVRYDADISLHAHFKCRMCGKVYDLHVDGLDALKIQHPDKQKITECQIYYKGYCETCKNEISPLIN